jgi:tetratricopeptide (TPR) repeat protein
LLRYLGEFERALFPFIVLSVWDITNERELLSNYLLAIVQNLQAPPDILTVIVAACDAMDRANFALFSDPLIVAQAAERCSSWFSALRFFEKALTDTNREPISNLLQIHSLLERKESALGLLQIANSNSNSQLWEALSMWDQARNIYQQRLAENNRDENAIIGYFRCSMLLEDWNGIESRFSEFETFSQDIQAKLALYFAAAADNKGTDACFFLNAIRTDDAVTCVWRTIVAIKEGNLDTA